MQKPKQMQTPDQGKAFDEVTYHIEIRQGGKTSPVYRTSLNSFDLQSK